MTMPTAIASIFRSPTARLLSLGALTLLLMVPLLMIDALVSDRRDRRDAAIADVSSKWGFQQRIVGPALIVPYVYRWTEPAAAGQRAEERYETRYATFLPARLQATGNIETEMRSRGIFTVPVYRATTTFEGEFGKLDWADLGVDPANAKLDAAMLVLGVSDARAIREAAAATFNGGSAPFLPGADHLAGAASGIHAVVAIPAAFERVRFSLPLSLNGSVGLSLAPFAELTTVDITSTSPNPSFTGNWLPGERSIAASGFHAKWTVPFLGRNYPQQWTSTTAPDKAIAASMFGVDLVEPVDYYRMADRSVKYGGLFVLLTFMTLWLIEVMSGVTVHPIQYLMVGAGLCIFFLLELTLAEQMRFATAYAISASAVIALVTMYGVSILGAARRSAVVGAGVTSLYGYLFVLLTNEDYALLIGSIGMFVILAGIMFVTRRVDWTALGASKA